MTCSICLLPFASRYGHLTTACPDCVRDLAEAERERAERVREDTDALDPSLFLHGQLMESPSSDHETTR